MNPKNDADVSGKRRILFFNESERAQEEFRVYTKAIDKHLNVEWQIVKNAIDWLNAESKSS